MRVVISQPMFFPWVGFFEQIRLCDVYVHYNDVQYSKGGFTNRVQVKAPEGVRWLTVPLQNLHLGQTIDQVQINNQTNWRKNHFDLLQRCYQAAPYYLDMLAIVDSVYRQEWFLLDDLARASLQACCQYFHFDYGKEFLHIQELNISGSGSDRVLRTNLNLGATAYITGHGAKNYLAHELFDASGIRVEYMAYQKTPYPQLFGDFTPYVSILDLIANTGQDAINWIHSETVYWKDFLHE
jgi:hypothetical protein